MKKIIPIALAILLIPVANSNAESMDKAEKTEITVSENDKMEKTELYQVSQINDENVILKLVKSEKASDKNEASEFQVDKDKFTSKDINVGDKYMITHDDKILPSNPAQFGKIIKIEKDSTNEDEKAKDKEKEESISEKFVVDEVNDEGYTISQKENKDNLYIISKEDAKNMDLKVGDEIEITHNQMATKSYPAQFIKIFDIKKIDNNKKESPKEEKSEEKIKAKKSNNNPKTGVTSQASLIAMPVLALMALKKTKNN